MKNLVYGVIGIVFVICLLSNIYLLMEDSKYNIKFLQPGPQNLSASKAVSFQPPQKHLITKDFLFNERHRTPVFTSQSACIPFSYGINPEEDSMYLYIKNYTCPKISKNMKVFNETVSFNCSSIAVLCVPKHNVSNLIGSGDPENCWVNGKTGNLNNSEFAFGKCIPEAYVLLRNVYKPSAASRASSISKALANKHQSNPRTLSFIYLIVDSMSRQSMFRYLKSTIKYLKAELNSNYAVYDFLLNALGGPNTPPNISLLYLGLYFDYIKKNIGEHDDITAESRFIKMQNKSALWTEFERNGFVTMFSTESNTDFISQATGRKIMTDHVVGDFWKVAVKYADFKEFSPGPQCIGGKMPHDYSLRYTKQFLKNYSKSNRAAFFTVNSGHEDNGSRLRTLDKPLNEFLRWVLTENQSDETVLVIAGDHGRYSNALTLDSYTERTVPGHLLVMSKSLVARLGIDKALKSNQDKLLHRLDWYETFKFLPKLVYKESQPSAKEIFDFKATLPHVSKNLFFEEVEQSRNCATLGVALDYCICHSEIVKKVKSDKETEKIVEKGVEVINQYINKTELEGAFQKILSWDVDRVEIVRQERIKDLKIYANISFVKANSTLIVAAFVPDPLNMKNNFNRNRLLATRTSILTELNKLNFTKYTFYNLFLLEPVTDLGLIDDFNYLCKPY